MRTRSSVPVCPSFICTTALREPEPTNLTVLTSLPARRLLTAVLCTLVPLIALLGVSVSAQASDDPDGVGLIVGVLGSTATPAPSATPRPSTRPSTTATSGVTQTTASGTAATAALGTDPVALAGVLAVSGLTAHAKQNPGPGGGDLVLDFTVKNLSTDSFTSSVRFWVDNALGLEIKSVDDISLADLAGGETRTVTVTLTEVGQWSAFNTHVTLTPPETVGETALSPVTRDALLLVPPYFALIVFSLLGAIGFVARYAILTKKLFPAGVGEAVS